MLEKVAVSPRGLVGSLGVANTDLLVSSLLGAEVAQYSPGLGVVVLSVVVQEFFCQLMILLLLLLKFLLTAGVRVVLGQVLTPWSEDPQVWEGQL